MADVSLVFDPAQIAINQSAASDAASAASNALSKATAASGAAASVSDAASNALSKAGVASAAVVTISDAASNALSKVAVVSDAASKAKAESSDAISKIAVVSAAASDAANAASDALSKIAVVSDAASNAQSKITARSTAWDTKTAVLKIYNEASAIASGDGKMYFAVPAALNGMNLTSVGGHLYTAATSGVVAVQVANVTSGVDMLSAARKLEWDATEKDTATAAASSVAVINTANDGVVTGEELRIDIDDAASGAKGMEIRLSFKMP